MKYLGLIILIVFSAGCSDKISESPTEVRFHVRQAYGETALLTIKSGERKNTVVDSLPITNGNQTLVFNLLEKEEQVFTVTVTNTDVEIYFINDVPALDIEVQRLHPDSFQIKNSPANNSLQKFLKSQFRLSAEMRAVYECADSLKRRAQKASKADSLMQVLKKLEDIFFSNYKNYGDTVKSPGAFLLISSFTDFGSNRTAEKKFITDAANRFPKHTTIQALRKKTLDYLKIFEEEYEVGQQLPEITLPQLEGLPFSTSSLRGKYYLLNFWSSWCGQCVAINAALKKSRIKFQHNNIEFVNIAIDSEKEACLQIVKSTNLNWPQLIDVDMWNGSSAKVFKIDSIPFNFLVDSKGKVLAKAIPADSIDIYFDRFVPK